MSKGNLTGSSETKSFMDWLRESSALIMIFICACALIAPFIIQSLNHTSQEITIRVCSVDSIPSDKVLSASDAAKVFHELEKQEMVLSEKYDYVLQQRDNEFRWQSYLSYVIGIIVSICGFFGYKSIQDVKQDVNKKIADITDERVTKYLEEKFDGIVSDKVKERMKTLYDFKINDAAYIHMKEEIKDDLINYYKEHLSELIIGDKQDMLDTENTDGNKNIPSEVRAVEEEDPSGMFNTNNA